MCQNSCTKIGTLYHQMQISASFGKAKKESPRPWQARPTVTTGLAQLCMWVELHFLKHYFPWQDPILQNNFEISHRSVWEGEIYTKFFEHLAKAGGKIIFYHCWIINRSCSRNLLWTMGGCGCSLLWTSDVVKERSGASVQWHRVRAVARFMFSVDKCSLQLPTPGVALWVSAAWTLCVCEGRKLPW